MLFLLSLDRSWLFGSRAVFCSWAHSVFELSVQGQCVPKKYVWQAVSGLPILTLPDAALPVTA